MHANHTNTHTHMHVHTHMHARTGLNKRSTTSIFLNLHLCIKADNRQSGYISLKVLYLLEGICLCYRWRWP